MTDQNKRDYYLRREAAARRLAEGAEDRAIRAIHLTMAERYGTMAASQPTTAS